MCWAKSYRNRFFFVASHQLYAVNMQGAVGPI
jgi:hypothetical protein